MGAIATITLPGSKLTLADKYLQLAVQVSNDNITGSLILGESRELLKSGVQPFPSPIDQVVIGTLKPNPLFDGQNPLQPQVVLNEEFPAIIALPLADIKARLWQVFVERKDDPTSLLAHMISNWVDVFEPGQVPVEG